MLRLAIWVSGREQTALKFYRGEIRQKLPGKIEYPTNAGRKGFKRENANVVAPTLFQPEGITPALACKVRPNPGGSLFFVALAQLLLSRHPCGHRHPVGIDVSAAFRQSLRLAYVDRIRRMNLEYRSSRRI